MSQKKTLHQREKELQSLLATKEGRDELHELTTRYFTASGKVKPVGRSEITYVLVHEREQGMIDQDSSK